MEKSVERSVEESVEKMQSPNDRGVQEVWQSKIQTLRLLIHERALPPCNQHEAGPNVIRN